MTSKYKAHSLFCTSINTGLPGYCASGIPVPRVLYHSLTEVTEVGKGIGILNNSDKFLVRVRKCFRTHTRSGWCGTGVQNSQIFRAGIKMLYPCPGYLWHKRRHYRGPGYGYECPTELTEFLRRVIPGANTLGMVLYVPCRAQPGKYTPPVYFEKVWRLCSFGSSSKSDAKASEYKLAAESASQPACCVFSWWVA